jgi:hypothetical protein
MKQVDRDLLNTDLHYRYRFLAEFIEFGDEEIDALHQAAPRLVPLLPALVDAVYEKMFEFDITKQQFLPRHHDYDGPLAQDLDHLTLADGQIGVRKEALIEYFTELLTAEYDEMTADYLDAVGKMHTTKGGGASIHTPLMLINIMLGYIVDALLQAVHGLDIDLDAKIRTLRAISKMLWIQQSFISRQYV